MFSKGSGSSTSLLTVTPSLVTEGPPKLLSRMTFRPVGPSVMPTARASFSAPARSFLRASSVYINCLAMLDDSPRLVAEPIDSSGLFHNFRQDIALTHDFQFFAIHFHFGAAVAAVEDFVPLGDGHFGALAIVQELP